MALNRSQFRKLLEPGLNTIFGMEYDNFPEEWRMIFGVTKSNKAVEEDQLVTGFGAAAVKGEGSGTAYDVARQAWTARYQNQTISLGFSITMEMVQDNLYGDIGAKYSKSLANSMMYTKEVKGADILNNAFDSNFAIGDGKELCATNHPLNNGSTLSNELATPADLSEIALEDAIIQIGQFTDDRGLPKRFMPRKLVIPIELQFEADRLLYSKFRPGTTDNDLNSIEHMGMFPEGFCVNHYLTDPDAWFILTSCKDGLKHFVRQPVQTYTEPEFDTGNIRYKAVERYVFGATDPRGIMGSAGA